MYCEFCNSRIAQYHVTFNSRFKSACPDCFENIFYNMANRGLKAFMGWLFTMYDYDQSVAKIITSTGMFNEEEVQKEFDSYGALLPMFTYGILKYPTNIQREGGQNIVTNCTVTGHQMYLYNQTFPITKQTGASRDKIYGTYFEVPAYVVYTSYDITEGFDPNRPAAENMYNRQIVDVKLPSGETKQANMYIANYEWFKKDMTPDKRIQNGNF